MFKFSTKLFIWKARKKKNGNSAIYLQVYISAPGIHERELIPMNLEWPMERIDFESNLLLARFKEDPDMNDYNMIIMSERAKLNDIAKKYRLADRFLTVDDLKRELVFFDSTKSVISYFYKKRDELYRKKLISTQTYKNYGTSISRMEEYDYAVRFDQLNNKWIDRYRVWLKDKKQNAYNTIWSRVKELKTLLKYAGEEVAIKVHDSALHYSNRPMANPITYLNKDDVKLLLAMYEDSSIYKALFPYNEPLREIEISVLRAFLFSCFTSLRISDIYTAQANWMLSDNFLRFTMQKNKDKRPKTIQIPIAPMAKELIKNTINGKFFNLPSQQEYNRTLKDLAEMVGIKKNLTSHVGRHTFGYLFMTSVGNLYALKEIMGHSKIETTQVYAHLDENDKMSMVLKFQEGFG